MSHQEKRISSFLEALVPAEEWEDPGLDMRNTSRRVANMYREELLASYQEGAEERLIDSFTTFKTDGEDGMVMEGPISFHSLCAHHVLPFSGEVYVGYIPMHKLVGASKLARVVEYYSRMLQNQERMTRQIATFVAKHAEARAVFVLACGNHLCMQMRGVKQAHAKLTTTALRPLSVLDDREIIDEFYRQKDHNQKARL